MAPFRLLARLPGRGGARGRSSALWLGSGALAPARAQIARFEVNGVITDDPDRDALLEELADDDARAGGGRCGSTRPAARRPGREALFASLRADRGEEAGGGGARRGRGLGRLRRGDRGRPYRRARQHADRLDRRHHGISRPDRGDGAARRRPRDGALLRAQGRALAVPPDEPGGAGARRGAGRRELRLVPRPRRRAARPRGRRARRGGERAGLHRAARRSRTGWSTRSAASPRRWPGSNCATPRLAGCRCGTGRSSASGRWRLASWARSGSSGGILGEISLTAAPKLYSIGP